MSPGAVPAFFEPALETVILVDCRGNEAQSGANPDRTAGVSGRHFARGIEDKIESTPEASAPRVDPRAPQGPIFQAKATLAQDSELACFAGAGAAPSELVSMRIP